jgi:hypothetical protein
MSQFYAAAHGATAITPELHAESTPNAAPWLTDSGKENEMRALFVGGLVDNSELDLDGAEPPLHYPENTGAGQSRYRLHQVGMRDGEIAYAVYGAPDLPTDEVDRVASERDYPRRFGAKAQPVFQ